MNTLQQIAGAIGTAVAISIMSAGQAGYISTHGADPTDPAVISQALTAGVQNAFLLALAASIVGLVVSFFIKRVKV